MLLGHHFWSLAAVAVATSRGRDAISGRSRRDVTCVERVEAARPGAEDNCEFSRRRLSSWLLALANFTTSRRDDRDRQPLVDVLRFIAPFYIPLR